MASYVIYELTNAKGCHDGTRIEAKNLTAAKVKAAKAQRFQRTYLAIENLEGDILAVRDDFGVRVKRD